jgi:glycosyltransferase involved in cell wall biosynthesis
MRKKMITEYRNAHIFICPSSIENSPNSLGEAQLIGVPVIAALCWRYTRYG